MLYIQHFLCWPQCHPSSKVPWGMGLEKILACDIPESNKFPALDSCHKRFLWTHKAVDLTPHPVVGLVFQVGDTKVSSCTWFCNLNSFFRVSEQDPCFTLTAEEEDGGVTYPVPLAYPTSLAHSKPPAPWLPVHTDHSQWICRKSSLPYITSPLSTSPFYTFSLMIDSLQRPFPTNIHEV